MNGPAAITPSRSPQASMADALRAARAERYPTGAALPA
jgi:hypothetical protein